MKRRGSVTVFMALLLTGFFSAVFAFLEAARVSGLKSNSQISTMQARDTVLASYDQSLWEEYHLLFWQADEGDFPSLDSLESLQQSAIEGNLSSLGQSGDNYYVLQVHLTEVTTSAYQLATDEGGAAFRQQAAEMMKLTVTETALQTMMGWITGEDTSGASTDLASEAIETLETLESAAASGAAEENTGGTGSAGELTDSESATGDTAGGGASTVESADVGGSVSATDVKLTENPLEWVKKMSKSGILVIVMPDADISQKSVDRDTCIENRTLESGNLVISEDISAMDKLLFYLYLGEYFSDASENSADQAMDYELEYMIAGKAEDQANLKTVVRRLLLMREAANLAYLETNSQKQQEAAAIATLLVSAVGQPELEPLVQQGLLAAWAYAESISDVRILLEGGKVSLVKTAEQWHTDLGSLSSTVYATEGEQQTKGLSYENYLQILMWMTSDEKLAVRAMDMIEKNTGVRMDQMVCRAECAYVYEASPLFWGYVTLGGDSLGTLQFQDESDISFMNQ
ncbi:MAG: DUF5702 domain-containing protein [Clostridiales bacterium]|nr:DUF5702 domain-containing protein [Clostridiales bacterium]